MTVDITTARLIVGDAMVKLADLPGVYSLEGHTDDEALVQRFLGTVALDAIVAVVNATRVELQLPLVLALKATGVPVLVVLNMADEAAKLGVAIDARASRPSSARRSFSPPPSTGRASTMPRARCATCSTPIRRP